MTVTASGSPDQLLYFLAAFNVASFFLGILAAALFYRPKIKALVEGAKKHAEECVRERMRQLESMLSGRRKPEVMGKRIMLPPDKALFYMRLLDDIQKPSGAYLFWLTMGEDFPETKVGNWRIDTTEALKPVLVQLLEPPTEPTPAPPTTDKPKEEVHAF